jgi:hypothetical protein
VGGRLGGPYKYISVDTYVAMYGGKEKSGYVCIIVCMCVFKWICVYQCMYVCFFVCIYVYRNVIMAD